MKPQHEGSMEELVEEDVLVPDESDGSETEEEPFFSDGSIYDTETDSTETEDEEPEQFESLTINNTNLRTEPKHIVFLTQLLLLFNFCHSCKADNPMVEARNNGTEVIVKTTCSNPKCPKRDATWHSQPTMTDHGIKGAAGNFLLSMAILFGGGSASKVFQIFSHMGLGCISLNTFFKYQRSKLFPTIYIHWKNYQAKMLEKLKALQEGIVIAGDGRHDSMGHSAKYGAYTIFCCTVPQIIHFSLVQRNQAGNSPAMEFYGFKSCMDYLMGFGLNITTFISDRHVVIACHMRKVLTNIIHYFDVWHLKKKIRKVLSKISKEKDCEDLKEWIKPCENHLYWSATSTFSGNGEVIWAKFKSFFNHILNKHSGFDDPLFNKCSHKEIPQRKWLEKGSSVYNKMYDALSNPILIKGIKQASPIAQTSCLEGFHSVVNQFSPKMIAYSYVGMCCRHILASLHFNNNLNRDVKHRESDGTERVRVSYPKFKNGEATVRNIKVAQNFDYVDDLYNTLLTSASEIPEATAKLNEMTPPPMNCMLEKQPKEAALKKREERRSMVAKDVPPSTPVTQVQAPSSQERSQRKCTVCKQPMKGHSKVTDCPRNRKT